MANIMRPIFIGAALFASIALISQARAATFGAKPNVMRIDVKDRIAQLEFSSLDARTNVFDVTVDRWSQNAGQDVLAPVNDPIVVPPIFSIAPYETVLVRLAFRTPPTPGPQEASYRVLIKEVLSKTSTTSPRIVSVPLFIPATTPTGAATYALKRASGNNAELIVNNSASNTHVYLGKLTIESDSKTIYTGRAAAYVLAGQMLTIPLKLTSAVSGKEAELRFEDERGDSQSATAPITP